jgi:hypothetical protein
MLGLSWSFLLRFGRIAQLSLSTIGLDGAKKEDQSSSSISSDTVIGRRLSALPSVSIQLPNMR